MAGTSVLKLKVDDKEYNSSLKQAQQGLQHLGQALNNAGKSFTQVDKSVVDYVRSIGQMEAQSKTARGRIGEMSNAFVELSLQYKKMSDEVKSSDVGKALAESMEQLKQRTIDAKEELDELNKSLNNVKMPEAKGGGLFSGLGDKMSGALQVFAGNMLTKAAGAVANLGSEMYDMVQQGVELAKQGEGIRIAFERLGRGDILQGLREATHGTVTDLELMKAAVKFNDFKLPLDELGTMLAFAQQKAKDTGQSVDYMVDSIVTGLGRKSLMILDNLGLSATEVKEKMAETGDMTKAVGAIIREQMTKAGDYVETAADRAAQADVELKNAMEELGRTFQPLTDASDSLWNSIKVGALNALNTAVNPLIQALAEAGALGQGARSTAGFKNLGGNTKVDRMIGRLGNGKSAGAYSIYQQQLGEFDKFINNKRFQIAAYGGDNSSVAQSAKAKLQTELDGALKMREEYVKRAQELHNQVPSPYEPPTSSSTTNAKGGRSADGSKSLPSYAPDSIAAQQKLVQDLTRQWNEAGAEVRNQYVQPLVEAEAKLKEMKDQQTLLKEQAQGKLLGDTPDGKGIEVPISSSASFEEWMNGVKEQLANLKIDPIEIPIETTQKDVKAITKAASMAADAVGNIGDAFNAIEDPAAKVMGTVMQAIASIALGFAQAASAKDTTASGWAWLAWLGAGTAALATTIATVHSLTGYAEGGIIKGNSYSGDNIGGLVDGSQFVGLNAGEVVLSASQQNNLAQSLQGGGGTVNVVGRVVGEDIFLSADRYARRSGRGGILTGKNL